MTRFLTRFEGCNVFFPPGFEALRFEQLEEAKDYVGKQPRAGGVLIGVGYVGDMSGWRITAGEVNQ